MKSLPALITTEEVLVPGMKERPIAKAHVNSAMQLSGVENSKTGEGEKELGQGETEKGWLRSFERIPRSENRNTDKMQIDVKKMLFSLTEEEELEESKKQKLAASAKADWNEESDVFLNAGLADQLSEKK